LGGDEAIESDSPELEPDFYFYDQNTKITYNPSDNDVLSLSIYSGRDNLTLVEGEDLNDFGVEIRDKSKWGNVGVSGKWGRQWNKQIYTDLTLAHSRYNSESIVTYRTTREFQRDTAIDIRYEQENDVRELMPGNSWSDLMISTSPRVGRLFNFRGSMEKVLGRSITWAMEVN